MADLGFLRAPPGGAKGTGGGGNWPPAPREVEVVMKSR